VTAAHNPPTSGDQPVGDRRLIRLSSARRRLIATLKHNNKVSAAPGVLSGLLRHTDHSDDDPLIRRPRAVSWCTSR
jgi:hypothetical protein